MTYQPCLKLYDVFSLCVSAFVSKVCDGLRVEQSPCFAADSGEAPGDNSDD